MFSSTKWKLSSATSHFQSWKIALSHSGVNSASLDATLQPLHLPHHRIWPQASSQLRLSFEPLALIQRGGSWQRGSRRKAHFHNLFCFKQTETQPCKLSDVDRPYTNVLKSMGLQMAVSNRRFSALQSKLRIGPSVTWSIHLGVRGTFTNNIYLTLRKNTLKLEKNPLSIYSIFNSFHKGGETINKRFTGCWETKSSAYDVSTAAQQNNQ